MRLDSVLVYGFLFTSGVLAGLNNIEEPTSDAASGVTYSENWVGAVWEKDDGTFTSVTGKFTIPVPSGKNTSATIWVGIDGTGQCDGGLLQTGVNFHVHENDTVTYHAWHEWYPAPSRHDDDFVVTAGDIIRATVVALNATSGITKLENLTRGGQSKVTHLDSTYALCMRTAEWIVEDNAHHHQLFPFAEFTQVTFTENLASGPLGDFTPEGAAIREIRQKGRVLTSVSIDGSDVTVRRVDPE